MTWVDLSSVFTFGSVLTSTQMQNLRDNIAAAFAKDSGAPTLATDYITAAMIAANTVDSSEIVAAAVGQGELKSTTQLNTTVTAGVTVNLSGGEYAFLPTIKAASALATYLYGYTAATDTNPVTTSTSYVTIMGFGTGSALGSMTHRYVQASPPYDLGDGVIPEFIFLSIDKVTGEIISGSAAKDAPWHHNGPTKITPHLITKNGKKYRYVKNATLTITDVTQNKCSMQDFINDYIGTKTQKIEITQEIKNKDMNLISTPGFNYLNDSFNENCMTIMLDPVCDLTYQLSIMREDPEFNLLELFHNDYFKIDNTHSGRKGPNGILIPKYKWKLTS